jgi:protein-disulfide isomerase
MESAAGMDLREAANLMLEDGDQVGEFVDVTVAGYSGQTYEFTNTEDAATLRFRADMVNVESHNVVILFMFGAENSDWEAFRPTVEAMIASIERADSTAAMTPNPNHPIRADAYWIRQDEPGEPFDWEDYGITVELPDGWTPITDNQDFDLVLASQEAMQGGSGSFITFRHIPTIGTDTPEAALTPVLDQTPEGTAVEAYTLGGIEGAAIFFTDESANTTHALLLIPYSASGDLFYIQANAAPGEEDVITSILDSVVIKPLQPDYATIDAAWQISLAEQGKLVYGPDDAPVKMVEILDFSCSHCAEYSLDVNRLIPLEVDPGRLQIEIVLVDLIGGDLSNEAAQAAYCATEQGKGYTAYKTLFKGYMEIGRDEAYTRDGINELLGDVGVDLDALNECLDAGTYSGKLTEAQAYWDTVGATGTPSVLLAEGDAEPAFMTLPSGEPWSGGIPITALRMVLARVIDEGIDLNSVFDQEATETPQ